MREKKYANILEEDEKNNDLSLTRELKFKALYENEEIVESNEIDLDNNDFKEIDEVNILEEELGEQNFMSNSDDIYLTTSFKPLKKRIRFRKIIKFFFKFIIFFGVVGAIIYFVAIPVHEMILNSMPKAIYDGSLDYIASKIDNYIDNNYLDSTSFDVDYIYDFDSNFKDMESLKDQKFGIKMSKNIKNNSLENYVYVLKDGNKYGYSLIQNNNENYYRIFNSEQFLKLKKNALKDESLYSKMNILLNYASKDVDREMLKYLIDTNVNILKKLIVEDLLTSEKDEIEVNGKTLNVIRNTLSFDSKSIKEFEKQYKEKILQDQKILEILSKLYGLSFEELKEKYTTFRKYDENYTLVINLYTIKGNKFAGFDIEENGFRNIYYYSLDDTFDFHLNFNNNDNFSSKKDFLLKDRAIIDLVGIKKDDYTEVECKYNDGEIAVLKVKNFGFNKVDLDYRLIIKNLVVEGDFTLTKISNNKIIMSFLLDNGENYLDSNIEININDGSINAGYVDSNKVVLYSEKRFKDDYSLLEEKLKEVNALEGFELWNDILFDSYFVLSKESFIKKEID